MELTWITYPSTGEDLEARDAGYADGGDERKCGECGSRGHITNAIPMRTLAGTTRRKGAERVRPSCSEGLVSEVVARELSL